MTNIIRKIDEEASSIVDSDLDNWIVKDLVDYFSSNITSLSRKTYGNSCDNLSQLAFKEIAKQELKKAASTFLFKFKYWQNNRSIGPYLAKTLNNLSIKTKNSGGATKAYNSNSCPGCKYKGIKSLLEKEKGFLRCNTCISELDRLNSCGDISENIKEDIVLHNCFSFHSLIGYECTNCKNFIPNTKDEEILYCPYPKCGFQGFVVEMRSRTHPVSSFFRNEMSLDGAILKKDSGCFNLSEVIECDSVVNADDLIDIKQQSLREYNILLSAINDNIERTKRVNRDSTLVQKLLMFEAYKIMCDKHPTEMVSYLVHRKKGFGFPIQSKIFQEFVNLIENYIPFSFVDRTENGKDVIIDVSSLTDSNLLLFEGISEFESVIDNNLNISNKTSESYVGGTNYKDYGPCFLGKLIDVIDVETNKSLLQHVDYYGFNSIKMNKSVDKNTKVIVSHFRIPSHYEIDSLVILQKARKSIVKLIKARL